jgi:hypothetical protein
MKHFYLFVCLLLPFVYACNSDKKIDEEYLQGKWIITEALRNGKKTNTLDGAFFFFDQKILTTNFEGIENQAEYTLVHNELKLTKGLDYTFHLKRTADPLLVMTVKIQNVDFEFKLKKE